MSAVATSLSVEEAEAFRAKCRAFLTANATGIKLTEPDPRDNLSVAASRAYQRKLVDAGLAGLMYPIEFGGAGLTRDHERIYREEYGNFPEMTGTLVISHGMCLPMISEYGTPEQKTKFMPRMISAEDLWCQMFSEPGAGSDVASLQSKAERDGDEWVLNGQKVWTTFAHKCEYGIVIARTDPEQPKHAGISMFILDMNAPGVEIRAIHQIDGGQHFNEVFFTDVRIPAAHQIGALNEGWKLATAMLMYERVAIGTGSSSGISRPMSERLIEEAKRRGTVGDAALRQDLMKLYSEETARSLVSLQTREALKSGKTPGPGGSLGKLHGAKIATMVRAMTGRLIGPSLIAGEVANPDEKADLWAHHMLSSFASHIAGGTDEIQKNIIGDRVLGLPREPMVDKDVPFRELKVGTLR
jgi:alkylation response protein AidB-like acyl-CoA dehydrogenase